MEKQKKNAAYIDGANLHKGVGVFLWRFDYKKFRVWLRDKYHVEQAYLFIGFVPKNRDLYTQLQEFGFTLIFKDVTYDDAGKIKGNCDVDVAVKMMEDAYENSFDKMILISSDGDYASLVQCLMKKEKLETIISPAFAKKCSILLKRIQKIKIVFLEDKKTIFERENKKSPR